MRLSVLCLLLLIGVGCDTRPTNLGGPSAIYVNHNMPPRGGLGISFNATPPGMQGAVVSSVIAGSTADIAGVAPGDVVVAIDGQPILSHDSLREVAQKWKPQQTLRLSLQRNQQELAIDVQLMTAEELVELLEHDPLASQAADDD